MCIYMYIYIDIKAMYFRASLRLVKLPFTVKKFLHRKKKLVQTGD